MNLTEYQRQAMRFALLDRTLPEQLENVALGLVGETGEIAEHLKKWRFHGHDLNCEHLTMELGDVLWYVALGCQVLDADLALVWPPALYHDPARVSPVVLALRLARRATSISELVDQDWIDRDTALTPIYADVGKTDLIRQFGYFLTALCCLAAALDIEIDAARSGNIAKLTARYGTKFSYEKSINRAGRTGDGYHDDPGGIL